MELAGVDRGAGEGCCDGLAATEGAVAGMRGFAVLRLLFLFKARADAFANAGEGRIERGKLGQVAGAAAGVNALHVKQSTHAG